LAVVGAPASVEARLTPITSTIGLTVRPVTELCQMPGSGAFTVWRWTAIAAIEGWTPPPQPRWEPECQAPRRPQNRGWSGSCRVNTRDLRKLRPSSLPNSQRKRSLYDSERPASMRSNASAVSSDLCSRLTPNFANSLRSARRILSRRSASLASQAF
jgi:hypothetical protein